MFENLGGPVQVGFKSEARMYRVSLVQDLFQDWVLVQSWGGRFSTRGGGKLRVVASRDDGLVQLRRIICRRLGRGYVLTGH